MDIPKIEWTITTQPPVISGDDIHIWHIDLSDLADSPPNLFQLLSTDERKRASRYHFETDRNSFVVRRAVLRMLLSFYVGQKAEGLQFTYNNFDRPSLEAKLPLCFNASSSNKVGIVAVALDTRIGIDIELVDIAFPKLEIAEKYFSAHEANAIRDLPPELQTAAFFDCWTKKEAYIKALGDGMSHPLPNLTISSDKQELFSVAATSIETKGWCITSFIPQQDYIASMAYEGRQKTVNYFRWPLM